jgi:anti-sigma B factor antagonist
MDITINKIGLDTLNVKAAGRLDLDNAVEYGTKIKDYIEDSDDLITEVTLDFSEITFISSFGLKVILELYKQLKVQEGTLKLKDVSEDLMNSFKMVGFDKFLLFE